MSYESICYSLNINAQVVKNTIINKIRTSRFFILLYNMNIYKDLCDQRIYNCIAIMHYMVEYVYFMKTPENINNNNIIWVKRYINTNQIDWKLMNKLSYENFKLSEKDSSHSSAAMHYNFFMVLNRFFFAAVPK